MAHEKASYEVIGKRQGAVQIEIMMEDRKRPIKHGIEYSDLCDHPDGPQACIEERVKKIAAAHHNPEEPDMSGVSQKKDVDFDPRTKSGEPLEDVIPPEERQDSTQ